MYRKYMQACYFPVVFQIFNLEKYQNKHVPAGGGGGGKVFASPCLASVTTPPCGYCRGCLMSPPCLESQGCHLIPLCYHLSCSYPSCLIFFCLLVLSSELFPENTSIFFIRRQAFLYDSCLAARRSKLVGGMCSMLPYGTGIRHYAFISFFLFLFFVSNTFF